MTTTTTAARITARPHTAVATTEAPAESAPSGLWIMTVLLVVMAATIALAFYYGSQIQI